MNDRPESGPDPFLDGLDPAIHTTADRVAAVIGERADGVEPSADAYARLATRVAAGAPGDGNVGRASWLGLPRLALVAATVVALGGGAVGLASLGDDTLDSAGPSEVTSAEPSSTTGQAATASDGSAVTDGVGDGDGDGVGDETSTTAADDIADGATGTSALTGPTASTRRDAARAFLDLIEVRFASVEIDGDRALISTVREGTNEPFGPIAVAELVAVDGGWAVASVSSDNVEIDRPSAGATIAGDVLSATGRGTGFEAWLDVELRSATDGVTLYRTGTGAGNFGELGPFSVDIPLVGTEYAWLIVASSGGADGMALPFAAVPVSYDAAADATPYVVVGIAVDDPDGGLNVRSGPGSAATKIGVLPVGSSVTRTPGAAPAVVGSSTWWSVEGAGQAGWVNSRYLAGAEALNAATLENEAVTFIVAAADPSAAGPWLPVSHRLGVAIAANGDTTKVSGSRLHDSAGWIDPLGFERGEGPSLAELVAAPSLDAVTFTTPATAAAPDGYGDLASITADYVGDDGVERRLHLYYESQPTGPALVAIAVDTDAG